MGKGRPLLDYYDLRIQEYGSCNMMASRLLKDASVLIERKNNQIFLTIGDKNVFKNGTYHYKPSKLTKFILGSIQIKDLQSYENTTYILEKTDIEDTYLLKKTNITRSRKYPTIRTYVAVDSKYK